MRGLVALACTVALVAPTAAAHAKNDKRSEAKLHYENGTRKFDLGKYDDAAEEFVQAYDLVGEPPTLLYNIAQAYRLAGKFEKSAVFYRSFLRKVPDVPNRAEIEGRITEMDERAADQRRQAERKEAEQREAERKAQKGKTNPDEPPVPQGNEPPPREAGADDHPRPGRALKIAGYALAGFTGASLGVGIAMTVVAVQSSNKVQNGAASGGVFDGSLQSAQSRGQLTDKLQIVFYSLAGAAAVGSGVLIYLGFRAEKQAQQEEAPQAARKRLRAMPLVLPYADGSGGGLAVVGRF